MTVVVLTPDLIMASRVIEAGLRSGVDIDRVNGPSELPSAGGVRLLLVDWSARGVDWGERLVAWCANAPESAQPRLILFGPHTDLDAHAAARAAGLGPMWARSKLLADLPTVFERGIPQETTR